MSVTEAALPSRFRRRSVGRMDSLTPDLIALLAVGVALAGLTLRQGSRLDARIDQLDGRIDRLGEHIDRLDGRIDRIEQGQAELRERMAKLEGLLEGLREAITGQRAA